MNSSLPLLRGRGRRKDGQTSPAMSVSTNRNQTLQGFSGSAVSSLTVRVNDYTALKELIRNSYGGRLVDVLEVKAE